MISSYYRPLAPVHYGLSVYKNSFKATFSFQSALLMISATLVADDSVRKDLWSPGIEFMETERNTCKILWNIFVIFFDRSKENMMMNLYCLSVMRITWQHRLTIISIIVPHCVELCFSFLLYSLQKVMLFSNAWIPRHVCKEKKSDKFYNIRIE